MDMTGVLITGGGGFLGSHLAELYLRKGIPVVCIDDFSTGLRSNKQYLQKAFPDSKKFQFIEQNVIVPWNQWASAVHIPVSHILHFASPASPPHYQRLGLETMWVNTVGLSEAMTYADQKRARVVFASTSEIYGDPDVSPQPETYFGNVNTQGPRSCYDEAKRFGEALIYTHNSKFKTHHGAVRIFNTYGPRMNPNDGRVIINFLAQAIQGQNLSVYGQGQQTRSFCYVDDLVSGIDLYLQTNLTEPVNIGSEKEFTILQLAETVRDIFRDKNIGVNFFELPQDDPKQRRP
ncbi:MAG: epimerase, partial [Bdellovibrio sp. CG10_big_fil_rev_8_21_14_0_10_47_8]